MNTRLFILILMLGAVHGSVTARHALSAGDTLLSRNFSLVFDNDMWNRTDRFYSNAAAIGYAHPAIARSPVSKILFPFRGKGPSINLHGIEIRQELYTPRDLEVDTIIPGDHPYAATLSLRQQKITLLPETGWRLESSLRVGVMGPAPLGYRSQAFIHRITPSKLPKGWDAQIQNDLLLNYDLHAEKELYREEVTQHMLQGGIRLGTMHTDANLGYLVRFHHQPDYFHREGPKAWRNFDLAFGLGGGAKVVMYDASLQGGLFNKTSPYIIPGKDIRRLVLRSSLSMVLEIRHHQLILEQVFQSSRFLDAPGHSWLGIAYRYWW